MIIINQLTARAAMRKCGDLTKLMMAGYEVEVNNENCQEFNVKFRAPTDTFLQLFFTAIFYNLDLNNLDNIIIIIFIIIIIMMIIIQNLFFRGLIRGVHNLFGWL